MSIAEAIYRQSGPKLQTLLVTAKGAQLAIERYGKTYRETLKALPHILAMTSVQARADQAERLRRFLAYARTESPLYAERLGGLNLRNADMDALLQEIPVLEKEDLRAHIDAVHTVGAEGAIEGHTGGTTGMSLVVRYTKQDFQVRMANLDYFKGVHGGRHGMRRASFTGKDLNPGAQESRIFWRTNWILRQRFYDTFRLNPNTIQRYVDDLNRFQPDVIDGFTSCIADICTHVQQSNGAFQFQPKAVFPTSEPLFDHQRVLIRETMGVEPRDQYASSEGAPFIVECARGNLHAWLHTGVFEVDETGDALVTSFTTHGTPLIRYRIGDRVAFADDREVCGCGWSGPLVERIGGRAIDFLWSEERGRVYSPNLSNVVKNVPNSIVKAQFTQVTRNSIRADLVVDAASFDSVHHRRIVHDELRARLGKKIEIDLRVVDDIPRSKSGKHRLVVNDLSDF